MKPKSGGNGSGKVNIGVKDEGGWVRFFPSRFSDLPDDFYVGLSLSVAQFFRERSHLRLRFIVPMNRDGTTVELHAWYDAVLFPDASGQPLQEQA